QRPPSALRPPGRLAQNPGPTHLALEGSTSLPPWPAKPLVPPGAARVLLLPAPGYPPARHARRAPSPAGPSPRPTKPQTRARERVSVTPPPGCGPLAPLGGTDARWPHDSAPPP